jgi:uncharacterized protein with NRDE domain
MCTLTIAFKVFDGYPLAVAANRDEFYVRPSLPPSLHQGRQRVFCPADAREGGTWTGVNEHGVFAGITNISGIRALDPAASSRGKVIMEALNGRDASEAAGLADALARGSVHNPFQAIVCDADGAFLIRHIETTELTRLQAGVHILSNWDALQDVAAFKEKAIRGMLCGLDRGSGAEAIVPVFKTLLSEHCGDDWQKNICVHIDGYGTMFSLVFLLGLERSQSVWESADGHPCEICFEDLSGAMKKGLGWAG